MPGKEAGQTEIEIRQTSGADEVTIRGYVNAVERDSRVLPPEMCPGAPGRFVERVRAGTFARALRHASAVQLRFNHARTVGSSADGTLTLHEDAIGLYADARVRDPEIVAHARRGELRGWSFGFAALRQEWEDIGGELWRRTLDEIELGEVSILTAEPAYIGTSIEMRGEGAAVLETRGTPDGIPVPALAAWRAWLAVRALRRPMPEARYSEDQSRDDAGRFADEGKSADGAAKAAEPQKTAGGLTNADTGATMKKRQLPSSTGANRFKKGFAPENLDAHWDGDGKTQPHKNQYRGLTKEQYAARAAARAVPRRRHGYPRLCHAKGSRRPLQRQTKRLRERLSVRRHRDHVQAEDRTKVF